MFDMNN